LRLLLRLLRLPSRLLYRLLLLLLRKFSCPHRQFLCTQILGVVLLLAMERHPPNPTHAIVGTGREKATQRTYG
jgi:hypothetical protein